MEDKNQIFQMRFIGPVKNIGMITLIVAIICLFIPGLYLYFFHGLIPPFWSMVSAIVAVWSFMAIMGVVEPIVYYPILGFGGTYMSFLVGNVLNLRVPVSATAQQVVGTKEGTPEAEIVSTLGIAGSDHRRPARDDRRGFSVSALHQRHLKARRSADEGGPGPGAAGPLRGAGRCLPLPGSETRDRARWAWA